MVVPCMGSFVGEISATSTAKFTKGIKSAATSFKSFNLYDTNIFATFFYSDIEKIWLVVVKSGMIRVNSGEVKTSTVLSNICRIEFGTVDVYFENIKDEIGLSQLLVERLLAANNGKISQEKILELAGDHVDSALVLKCLKANKLFCEEGGFWRIDYRNYIDFLEGRADPLRDTVLYELGSLAMSTGHSKTFNINAIWENAYFAGGYVCPDVCTAVGVPPGRQKGILNWPHSACTSTAWRSCNTFSMDAGAAPQSAAPTPPIVCSDKIPENCDSYQKSNSTFSSDSCARSSGISHGRRHLPATKGNGKVHFGCVTAGCSSIEKTLSSPGGCPGRGAVDNGQHYDAAATEGMSCSKIGTQNEPKVAQINTLLDQYTTKNKPVHRKCYSMADGPSYLEGYRVPGDSSDKLIDEDKEISGHFDKIKRMAAEICGSSSKFLDCKSVYCVDSVDKPSPTLQVASPSAIPTSSSQAVQGHDNHCICEMLKMSRVDFVENYVVDFTSNESSTTIFDVRSSEPLMEGPTVSAGSHVVEPFAFTYNRKRYVPKKRKSLLFPVKRYKFYFMLSLSPKVHDLPNYSSGIVITSEYHSDRETCSDEPESSPRARSHSKGEPHSFTGRDYDYDLVSLIGRKREHKRKCIIGNYFNSSAE